MADETRTPFAPDKDIVDIATEILSYCVAESAAGSQSPSREIGHRTAMVTNLLFHRCLRLYRGICTLLHAGLAEEARMLARALLEDDSVIAYLALAAPADREELAARYLIDAIRSDLEVYASAPSLGIEPWADSWAEINRRIMATLQDELRQAGVKKVRRFPRLRERLARRENERAYAVYRVFSATVHGSFGRLTLPLGEAPFDADIGNESGDVKAVTAVSGQLILSTLRITALLLGWPNEDRIATYARETTDLLDSRLV